MNSGRLLIAFALLLTTVASAQTISSKTELEQSGDASFGVFAYEKAIESYEASSVLSTDGKRRLAISHARSGNYVQAERVYSSLVNLPDCQTEDLYEYAMILRSNNRYREAQGWMDKYAQRAGDSKRARSNTQNKDLLDKLLKDPGTVKLKNLNLNTSGNEFAPVILGQRLVFSATSFNTTSADQFLNLYVLDSAKLNSSDRVAFKRKFNQKYHEGVAAFSGKGNRMFFTSSSQIKQGKNGEYNLGIYWSDLDDKGRWTKPNAFPFNDPNYSLGQPSVTTDGNTLYFSSNRPGGFGGVDLWKSTVGEDGEWTTPVNLGSVVNTESDELFPFVHSEKNALFFSSNGHLGLGGLDVFVSLLEDAMPGAPKNLGCPVNSSTDDFSFALSADLKQGFLASNRYGGKGGDDIWELTFLKPIELAEDQAISGVVQRRSGAPVPEATVSVVDGSNTVLGTIVTDPTGKYLFRVPKAQKYMLRIEADGFKAVEKPVVTEKGNDFIELPLVLSAAKVVEIVDTVYVKSSSAPTGQLYTTAQPIEKLNEKASEKGSVEVKEAAPNKAVEVERKSEAASKNTAETPSADQKKVPVAEKAATQLKEAEEKRPVETVEVKAVFAEKSVATTPAKSPATEKKVETPAATAIPVPAAGAVWESVYFAFNSSWLESEDRLQLNRIVSELNRNPNMAIELRSYTDCRADDTYNQMLSEKRLAHVIEYIRPRISNPYRVRGLAMGELPSEAGCDCESKETTCAEEVLQKSRRVDVIVVKK